MKRTKIYIKAILVALFLFNVIIPKMAFTQEAVFVMTLFEKMYYAEVSMTPLQLSALAEQPDIIISSLSEGTSNQIIIPIPSALGGGFIVAEPEALAKGMNAVGITTVATEASVLGAISVEGNIIKGAGTTIAQQIQSDVAAKVPLSVIIKNALDAGMTLEGAISAIIKAEVNTAVIVYTAINEGHPADTIIRAAIKAGAPLDEVVSGAIGAGVESNLITTAAVDAGTLPSQVADSIATFTAPGAQVFGFTQPPDLPVFPTVPVGGAVGGPTIGGGGGTIASPVTPN